MEYFQARYEIPQNYPSWYIVLNVDFLNLTSTDLIWPLTSIKILLEFNVENVHDKWEIPQISLLKQTCLWGFRNLAFDHPKWALIWTKDCRVLELDVDHQRVKYGTRSLKDTHFEIWFSRVFYSWTSNGLNWPLNSTKNKTLFKLNQVIHILTMRFLNVSLLEISCLQVVCKVFVVSSLVTPDFLWPPPKQWISLS